MCSIYIGILLRNSNITGLLVRIRLDQASRYLRDSGKSFVIRPKCVLCFAFFFFLGNKTNQGSFHSRGKRGQHRPRGHANLASRQDQSSDSVLLDMDASCGS